MEGVSGGAHDEVAGVGDDFFKGGVAELAAAGFLHCHSDSELRGDGPVSGLARRCSSTR